MRILLLLGFGLCTPVLAVAAMFSWTDQSGNLTFGDKPPEGVVAKEITPPKLTVLEGFGSRYDNPEQVASKPLPQAVTKEASKPIVNAYKKLTVIAPKQGQGIRANDGDVSVAVSLSPKLQKSHKFVFTLDGKQVQESTSTVANMENLDRGAHQLQVRIIDEASRELISSEVINFSVLRAIASKNKAFNPYEGSSSQ